MRHTPMSHVVPKIPTEIIYQIFAPFSSTLRTCDLTSFPWFLGHICSTWRSIFLSMTTEFWRSIVISFYGKNWSRSTWHSNGEHARRVLQFYLERDATAPFSFMFMVSPLMPREEQDNVRQMLEMLIDESVRWKDVSLRTSFTNLLLLGRAQDRLPLLHKLHLVIPDLDEAVELGRLNSVFQTAPSLNVVDIPKVESWEFSWANLKDVALKYANFDLYTVLPQMTNLARLSIRNRATPDPGRYNDVISLPHLTTLNCDHLLLQLIEAPALEDLTILCQHTLYQRDVVLSFLRRSSCNIRYLHIREAEAATAIDIIGHTPQIIQLKLFDVTDMGLVLEQLTFSMAPGQGQDPLAHYMLSLHIYAPYVRYLSTLHRLILSRTSAAENSGCERLQRLGISRNLLVSNDMRESTISLCKERGVELVWEDMY